MGLKFNGEERKKVGEKCWEKNTGKPGGVFLGLKVLRAGDWNRGGGKYIFLNGYEVKKRKGEQTFRSRRKNLRKGEGGRSGGGKRRGGGGRTIRSKVRL